MDINWAIPFFAGLRGSLPQISSKADAFTDKCVVAIVLKWAQL